MKRSVQVLAWVVVRACVTTEAALTSRLTPRNATANVSRLHPILHSTDASVVMPGAASVNASVDEISQELESLRDTRFYSRAGSKGGPVKTVWIVGLGRSGTTLLQNLIVSAAAGQGFSVFAAFEPCHSKDFFQDRQVGHGQTAARECIQRALQCDFNSIDQKHYKKTRQQLARRSLQVPPYLASETCAMSTVRVFKTIYPMATSFEQIKNMIHTPEVSVIQISRDPRAIFSSVYHNKDFTDVSTEYTPKQICQVQLEWVPEWKNVDFASRLLPVRFESLVSRHTWEKHRALEFLSWQDSTLLDSFIQKHMSARDCKWANKQYGYKYGTCRTAKDTMDVITKWKRYLDSQQKTMFTYGACKRAVDSFGYRAAWKSYV
jgi:hypothetical protein